MQKRFDEIILNVLLAVAAATVVICCLCMSYCPVKVVSEPPPETRIPMEQPKVSPSALDEEPQAQEEPAQEDKPVTYSPNILLAPELQSALQKACEAYQVPECLALGLMEVESRFQVEADNGQCYGLMQLNRDYFPSNLSPAENIWAGVEYLGRCLRRYKGDIPAALCAYNAGHDTGYRGYANAVLAAAERWAESY